MTTQTVDLAIGGMTCASCAVRVEKKLNRMPGVQASVNFATEKARVSLPAGTGVGAAIATVEATGYSARLPEPPQPADPVESDDDRDLRNLRRRLPVSAALALPVVLLAMIPAVQFDYWQWLSLTLAAPVVVWGGWPFHRAALANLRHGAVTMDTLISIGVLAAFGWSVYALFFGGAGMPGHARCRSRCCPARAAVRPRSTSRSPPPSRSSSWPAGSSRPGPSAGPAPHCVRCSNSPPRTSRCFTAAPNIASRSDSCPSVTCSWCGQASGSRRTARWSKDRRQWTPACSPASPSLSRCLQATRSPARRSNAGGRLIVRATRVGADTALAQLARLVDEAQSGKAPVQRLADRVSAVFVPIVLVLAAGTLLYWLATGAGAEAGVHRGRRGAGHRLPVRARPGHPDRAAGRHRPRCAARRPDQGAGDPRVDPPGRHDRAGQDRHRDHRRDAPGGRGSRRRHRPGRAAPAWPARWRMPRSIRSHGPSRPPHGAGGAVSRRSRRSR